MLSPSSKFNLKVKKTKAGFGLVTLSPIAKGETIIEYVGNKVSATNEKEGRYLFGVNKKWDIDGSPRWNTARYINHSCRPNCEAINRRDHIFIVAWRNIKPGEELGYNYGKAHFEAYIKPHGCRCVKCTVKHDPLPFGGSC